MFAARSVPTGGLICCSLAFQSFTEKEILLRVGVFTPLLSQLSLDDVLKKLKGLGVTTVELGTGNYPGDPHCKLSMLDNAAELDTFRKKLADNGFSISALSSHGNPLHPDSSIAKANQEVSRKTILLAEKLGVPVVIDFSGCPGDSDTAKYPNWVTCPWPPEYLDVLDWQWEKKVTPYWRERAKFAEDHGVKIASRCIRDLSRTVRKRCCSCAQLPAKRSAATTTPATCSGRASIRSPRFVCSGMRSSTFTRRTRRFIAAICQLRVFWIRRSTPMNGTVPGFSARWATGTAMNGGASLISTLRMFGYDYVLDRTRGQHSVARGRAHKGDPVPRYDCDQRKTSGGMVGITRNFRNFTRVFTPGSFMLKRLAAIVFLLALASAAFAQNSKKNQPNERSVNGEVNRRCWRSAEGRRGAAGKYQDASDPLVHREDDGTYVFNGLNTDVDYQLSAQWSVGSAVQRKH